MYGLQASKPKADCHLLAWQGEKRNWLRSLASLGWGKVAGFFVTCVSEVYSGPSVWTPYNQTPCAREESVQRERATLCTVRYPGNLIDFQQTSVWELILFLCSTNSFLERVDCVELFDNRLVACSWLRGSRRKMGTETLPARSFSSFFLM